MNARACRVQWEPGGDAILRSFANDAIVFSSSRPWPPGTPVAATTIDAPTLRIAVKVNSSRRVGDGTYEIHARLVTPTRELRAALAALTAPGPP